MKREKKRRFFSSFFVGGFFWLYEINLSLLACKAEVKSCLISKDDMPPGLIDPERFHVSLRRGLTKKLMSVEDYQLFFCFFEFSKK